MKKQLFAKTAEKILTLSSLIVMVVATYFAICVLIYVRHAVAIYVIVVTKIINKVANK
ncbi:MAG: hypothetical protein ACXAEX_02685 [Promethearchaeota archaeon]